MAWTDEKRAKAVELYLAQSPTAETSVSILGEVAEELEETMNSVRAILSKAGVYVKKEAAPSKTKAAASGDKAPRVSKEAAIAALREALEAAGKEVDEEIISKLTGKAAVYFASLFGE
jgi:enolase